MRALCRARHPADGRSRCLSGPSLRRACGILRFVEELESPQAGRRRWVDLAIVAGFLTLVSAFFIDVLLGHSVLVTRDLSRYHFPMKAMVRDGLLSGEFPFWNWLAAGGQPLAANPAYEVFYPLQWLVALPDFVWWFHVQILLHLVIGLAGMYFLLRRAGAARAGSVGGALSFGVSPFLVGTTDLLPIFFPIAWLPWVALATMGFAAAPSARRGAAAALVFAIPLLIGEPSMILQSALVVLAFSMHGWWSRGGGSGALARGMVAALAIGIAGSLIAAVQLVPAVDHALASVRRVPMSWSAVVDWSFPPVRLMELFVPELFGRAVEEPERFWGGVLYEGRGTPFILNLYVGIAAFVCFLAAVVSRVRYAFLAVLLCAASLALALGESSIVVRALFDAGILGSMRYLERFVPLVGFAVAFLGGIGLDGVLRGDRRLLRRATMVALALFVALAAGSMVVRGSWFEEVFARLAYLHDVDFGLRVIGRALAESAGRVAVLLLLLAVRRHLRAAVWSTVLLAFIAVDVTTYATRYVQRFDPGFYEPPRLAAELRATIGSGRFFHASDLQTEAPEKRLYYSTGSQAYWFSRNGLMPYLPSAWGIPTVLLVDYDMTQLRATAELHAAMVIMREQNHPHWEEIYFSMSNVAAAAEFRPFAEAVRAAREIEEIVPVTVTAVDPAPRYFFARRVIEVRSLEDFIGRVEREYERGDVLAPLPPLDWGEGVVLRAREGRNEFALDVEASRDAVLYASVTYDRYWKAFVDGNAVRIVRANVAYQAVVVPTGRHSVRFVYRNPWVVAGGVISILALAAAALALTLPLARRS
jgi:hypothetical protein